MLKLAVWVGVDSRTEANGPLRRVHVRDSAEAGTRFEMRLGNGARSGPDPSCVDTDCLADLDADISD